MIKRLFIPVIALLVIIAAGMAYFHGPKLVSSQPAKKRIDIIRTTLGNGMELVVVPIDRVPAITHMLVVKAGGADDPGELPGLAHFLEHMMFTGTQQHPAGEYDSILAKLGASHNAFTTYDYTAYHVTIAKEHLETVMQLESDRFKNLLISDDKAAREVNVIAEERRLRVDNHPASQLAEQVRAVQFLAHPYGRPLIGWQDTITRFSAKAARTFYERYYRASNMALIVVGDIEPQQVYKLAANYYGKFPTMPAPERSWPKEPDLRTERKVILKDARVQQSRVSMVYALPSVLASQTDMPKALSLEVLAHYLGADRTGLLYRELVRNRKLATELYVSVDNFSIGPGRLVIYMALADGVKAAQAEAALDAALQNLRRNGLDADLLAQTKNVLAAQAIYARDGLNPIANIMAELVALNQSEELFYNWGQFIQAVNTKTVLESAQRVLFDQPRVTGYLLPQSAKPVTPPSVPVASADVISGEVQ